MAVSTGCQTPGAQFHTHIGSRSATVTVDFGRSISLTDAQAGELEANLHNAVELVLARYYPARG